VFTDPKRRRQHDDPPLIPGIVRRQRLHMLGITVANDFSVSEHVQDLTVKSVQTIYALRVLRAHRLKDAALQQVQRSVVFARLLYASSAYQGHITSYNLGYPFFHAYRVLVRLPSWETAFGRRLI